MALDVIGLVAPSRGHFDLGTGYHGDVWLDLDSLFLRPALLESHISQLSSRLRDHHVDAVCGPLEGGAFLAYAIAASLGAAFLPVYRVSAPGQADTGYDLPFVQGGIAGWRVAIADDAVNAGTAVRACAGLLRARGARLVAVAALLALGPAVATGPLDAVPCYASGTLKSDAWPADRCLLCAGGVALDEPPA